MNELVAMLKQLSIATLGLAALVLNPSYACRMQRDFDFQATDMRAAVEGTWTLTTATAHYTFDIEQASAANRTSERSLIPSAHACGSRTLVKSAGACEVETIMPIELRLADGTADGSFEVYGSTFVEGSLKLYLDHQAVYARVARDGTVTEVSDGATLIRTRRR